MNAYSVGRARVIDECLQIHHKPCDIFENSMNQRQLIEERLNFDTCKRAIYTSVRRLQVETLVVF